MSDAATSEPAPTREAPVLLGYRCAAADMLHAARLFVGASARLDAAARALDPDGTRAEDPAVLALAESVADVFAMAAITSPGVRLLFAQAIDKASALADVAAGASACTP